MRWLYTEQLVGDRESLTPQSHHSSWITASAKENTHKYMCAIHYRNLLYPPPPGEAGPSKYNPNVYQPFRLLGSQFEQSLREMVRAEKGRMKENHDKGSNGKLQHNLRLMSRETSRQWQSEANRPSQSRQHWFPLSPKPFAVGLVRPT